jgi:hypothetical protein
MLHRRLLYLALVVTPTTVFTHAGCSEAGSPTSTDCLKNGEVCYMDVRCCSKNCVDEPDPVGEFDPPICKPR